MPSAALPAISVPKPWSDVATLGITPLQKPILPQTPRLPSIPWAQTNSNVFRKHAKRHTRPYGCTYTSCSKAFGSKNDWKRHENTQHYQIETWRCHHPRTSSRINQCAKIFYRREQFTAHLKDHHDVKDEEQIREQSKRVRIGRNGQSGFWCGFCKMVVALRCKGLEAWDERFDHIDDFHFKKGEKIDERWYPLESDIPKGLLRNENVLDSGGPSTAPDESDTESSEEAQQDSLSPEEAQCDAPVHDVNMDTESDLPTKQQRVWYCVSCFLGFINPPSVPIADILREIVQMQFRAIQQPALCCVYGRSV